MFPVCLVGTVQEKGRIRSSAVQKHCLIGTSQVHRVQERPVLSLFYYHNMQHKVNAGKPCVQSGSSSCIISCSIFCALHANTTGLGGGGGRAGAPD